VYHPEYGVIKKSVLNQIKSIVKKNQKNKNGNNSKKQ